MNLSRNLKALFFIFLLAISLSGCSNDDSRQMFKNANEEFKKANYSGAKIIYAKVVSEHSYSDEATEAKEILAKYDEKISLNEKLRKEADLKAQQPVVEKSANALPQYEIVHKITGDGYMTFFVYVDSDDDKLLIDISNDFKNKHKRNLKLGFQVRFVRDKNARTNQEGFAVYAYTRHLNLSRLTKYDSSSEYIVLDNL